jgi:branched-chain amino acid transport system substrate-binding protein
MMTTRKCFSDHSVAVRLFAIICLTAFFAGGCTKVEEPAEEAAKKELPPIKIAVVGPHSGDLASYGLPTVNAAELVAAQRNAKCGINGRKIELVVEDDACKPEIATNSATKVIDEGVQVVLGPICSGATKAALGLYQDAKLVAISPSATSPALTQSGDHPNFFRTIASDDAQARLEVDFALNKLNLTKFAVLHDKGDYGKGLAEYAKGFIEADSRAQVVLFEGITANAVDYSAVVNKIKQSGAEAVIYGGYHPEASKLVSQMRKKAMDTIFISDDGVKDDTFIKVAGEYAEGVYASGPMDTTQNPMAKEAIAAHREKYGEDPGSFFLNAYAAALALVNALEKSCSTNYDDIVTALRTEWVATPLGIIKFDQHGDAIGVGFAMYQVQDGAYVEVKN